MFLYLSNETAVASGLTKKFIKPLTDDQGALDFLQNEAGLVGEFTTLCSQHADQPVLSKYIVLHPQLKEVLEDILHRFVLLQAANMVKQNLFETEKKNRLRFSEMLAILK